MDSRQCPPEERQDALRLREQQRAIEDHINNEVCFIFITSILFLLHHIRVDIL